ncbi:hypothetical protein HWV62_22257 [Athelia sp. TMB]|nr:hypothetical protein HWV62_22257 [Athelia sp. TMB]
MTTFIPLDANTPLPQSPSFLSIPHDLENQLSKALKSIMKAKRIVVVCGAGISVRAGIPDFRSPEGLFQTLKRDNPREALTSGKDLFDASVFNSEHTTSLFCQMIAQLSELSQAANPTPFHQILHSLDQRGKLLRVYTQNIDAIESKSGLSFGVPEFEGRRKPRLKGKGGLSGDETATPTPTRLASPPGETPRCIPLHGTLQTLHCQTCTHVFPLEDYLPSLATGTPPYCPECTTMEQTRQLVGKRARGVGKLRPSVVLYNEAHKDGEGVGEVVERDLVGGSKGKARAGADLLLVAGTSLRVPGTKRIVREFSKAVRSRGTKNTGLSTPQSTPQRTPPSDDEVLPKVIYLNLDFPVPTREWEGVFDTWIQGDAQGFADLLGQEIEKEVVAKEAASEKKRKREEENAALEAQKRSKKLKIKILPPTPQSLKGLKGNGKHKHALSKPVPLSPNSKVGRPRKSPKKTWHPEVLISSRPPKPPPLDRDEDLRKDPSGRWIRGPLVMPGQSDVLPVVDQVDDYRSFKMFDQGWILPENSKRGGRATIPQSPLHSKRRAGPASHALAQTFTEQPDELPVIIEQPA